MDEEEFDATRETCMLLGGKLMDIRAKQHRCYSDNEDLEIVINREIMAIRYNTAHCHLHSFIALKHFVIALL